MQSTSHLIVGSVRGLALEITLDEANAFTNESGCCDVLDETKVVSTIEGQRHANTMLGHIQP